MTIERRKLALVLSLSAALGAHAAPASATPRDDASASVHQARRARTPVTLAEATSSVDPKSTRLRDVIGLLREDAAAALAAIDWSTLRLSRRYAVSASIMRLETSTTGARALSSACAVSVAVRDLERGTLLFIVEGRARAEDAPDAAERAERDALRAAVNNAIAAVPNGLKRTQ
ncbi:Hypothetical protein A7982_05044 [Minicystis rosea]|nr:Hypothetical protein A7982_05044 [Minicystis rosea]